MLVSKRKVTDGLSNTFLVGEKRLRGEIGKCQHDDNEGWVASWDWDTIRWGHYQPQPDRFEVPSGGSTAFGSSHPGVFHVVMGDGAVRPVDFDVEKLVFLYLAVRDDGAPGNP